MSADRRGTKPSIDQAAFGRLVDQVIEHLYDQPYLQTHPLGDFLAGNAGEVSRGRALQRCLLDAIDALKPTDQRIGTAQSWRTYRYLFLRFVQAIPASDVASELAIGERQARRVYRKALDALASILWDRLGPHRDAATVGEKRDGPLPPAAISPLDEEIQQLTEENRGGAANLADIVMGLRPLVDPLAARYGFCWSVDLGAEAPRLATDRVLVRQILLHLFLTIFPSGPGRLALTASATNERIRITLAVAGVANPTILPDERLEIIRRLVKAGGGSFTVHRQADDLEVISLLLPIASRPKVLVIDDNPDVIRVLQRYLESFGCDVVTARNSIVGFRLAGEIHPAVITLDVMMPTQDGWEALQQLKNHPETEAIPVIICSVIRENELARFLGAAEILPKPVTRPDLLAAMNRCGVSIRPLEPQETL